MGTDAYRGYSGNGGSVAPRRLPALLEADFQSAKASWATTNSEASTEFDFQDGGRESDMGSTAGSW